MELPESNKILIVWSDNGTALLIATSHSAFILRYDQEAYQNAKENEIDEEDGVESAFELIDEISLE